MVGSLVAVCGGFQVSFLFSGGNEFFDSLVGRIGLNSNNTGFRQMVGDRNDVIDGEGSTRLCSQSCECRQVDEADGLAVGFGLN